jgi:hypothetical protein
MPIRVRKEISGQRNGHVDAEREDDRSGVKRSSKRWLPPMQSG